MPGPGDHHLYLLFTPALCADDPWRTLAEALRGGVDLVQWRHPERDPEGARRCLDICRNHGVPLLINDHVELAARLGAAGAHVGQTDLPAAEARALLGPDAWLGVSTRNPAQIDRARRDGADHVGFGPMNPTRTKGYTEGHPPDALRTALATARGLPVFAIGGIELRNLDRIRAEGCRRIAVSGAILRSDDPGSMAGRLREALLAPAP